MDLKTCGGTWLHSSKVPYSNTFCIAHPAPVRESNHLWDSSCRDRSSRSKSISASTSLSGILSETDTFQETSELKNGLCRCWLQSHGTYCHINCISQHPKNKLGCIQGEAEKQKDPTSRSCKCAFVCVVSNNNYLEFFHSFNVPFPGLC